MSNDWSLNGDWLMFARTQLKRLTTMPLHAMSPESIERVPEMTSDMYPYRHRRGRAKDHHLDARREDLGRLADWLRRGLPYLYDPNSIAAALRVYAWVSQDLEEIGRSAARKARPKRKVPAKSPRKSKPKAAAKRAAART